MIRRYVAIILLCSLSLAARDVRAQSDVRVRHIVDDYIAARGGLTKINAIRNLVFRSRTPDGHSRFFARARPFYYLVGEPSPTRTFAEGSDGSAWEYYGDAGIVIRTTGAPAAAGRHTSYFDDPLVSSLGPGWKLELLGLEKIASAPAWALRATYPDGFQVDLFVDTTTKLLVANRKAAPYHAFGDAVKTETRIGHWRDVGGALFPTSFQEFEIETGKPLSDLGGDWTSVEYNLELPADYFSPPPPPATPLARMLNSAYAARAVPTDALGWYNDFRQDPKTAAIDTRAGIEAVGYQCLKNDAVDTGLLILQANVRDYPRVASAHFGLGRAYRAAHREPEALAEFKAALALDPTYKRASDALAAGVTPTAASH